MILLFIYFLYIINVEFCLEQAHFSSQITVSSSKYFDGIQDELRTVILENKVSNDEVFEWINVSA